MTTKAQRAVRADMDRRDKAMKAAMMLTPALASKIASVVVHADELLSAEGHAFDKTALEQACCDLEVRAWIKSLGPLAPVKR